MKKFCSASFAIQLLKEPHYSIAALAAVIVVLGQTA